MMNIFNNKTSLIKAIKSSFSILILLFASSNLFAQSAITVKELSCNNLNMPTGILAKPIFGWKMNSSQNGQLQTAYQILVSSSLKNSLADVGDIWDSKKVNSSQQFNIQFNGKTLVSSKKYFWKVRVWDEKKQQSAWSASTNFITGLVQVSDLKAKWITNNKVKQQAAPLFRKSFNLLDVTNSAIIQISGLGYYELYVNGKKVGDNVLDPGQTNYDDYAFYVTYDINSYLKKGENVIGIMLGDGWYNQNVVWGGNFFYGSPQLWCQLDMNVNGKPQQIISDKSWKWIDGPIQFNNVYAGEIYDANKEIKDWNMPNASSENWQSTSLSTKFPPQITPQDIPPIKKMLEIKPTRFFKTNRGTYIFDMGQNFAGWNRLKVTSPKGTEIKMTMVEDLLDDGTLNQESIGFRATKVEQVEKYICKGDGLEIWEPRFTYHGFRYVEVSGLTKAPTKDLLTGIVVHSSMPQVGDFSCSNPQINKLHKMSYWTMISNLHSIPTDCPAREKCGWLGDAHAMAPATIYNFDMQNFWIKYLDDIHSSARVERNIIFYGETQGRNFITRKKDVGIPFIISPGKRLPTGASPDWGTAVVQLPWFLYKYYGNQKVLKKFYPDMDQWVNFVSSISRDNIVYEGLGDWCPPGTNVKIDCPIALSSTAFHYHDLTIMKDVAGLLNNKLDSIKFSNLANDVKKAFIAKFYNPNLNSFGSHTANAMVLDFGLYPDGKATLISNAIAKTSKEEFDGFMASGIFGLPRIFGGLAEYGNQQTAYNILNKKGEYSFEMMWKYYDATTLYEVLPVFTDPKNKESVERVSHNHPMQAGFDRWFYDGVAGIKPDIKSPGFKKIILEPYLTNQLDWAKGSYDSIYGKIISDWKKEKGKMIWDIDIPVNTSADVLIPNNFTKIIINNGKMMTINSDLNRQAFKLNAGKYKLILQ